MAEKLEFDLLVKQNDLSKTLKDASNQAATMSSMFAGGQPALKSLNDEIEKTSKLSETASDFMSQFRTQTLGVAAGQFVFSSIANAINFITSSVTGSIAAYSESEDAVNKLNQALNITGSYSESTSQSIQQFAARVQLSSKYNDEAVLSQFNFAKSLGLSNAQAKNLTEASVNLSAQLGGSLEENTSKLARVMSGELPRSLKALIPELKSLTQEQLRSGAAADIINQKYGGAAANELNTYSGKVASLKNAFDDLQESIGGVIVKSSPFQSMLDKVKSLVDETNNSVKASDIAYVNNSGAMGGAARSAEVLADQTVTLDKEIANLNKSLEEQKGRSWLSGLLFDDSTIGVIESQIRDLSEKRKQIEEKLQFRGGAVTSQETPDNAKGIGLTAEQEEAIRQGNLKILALDQELSLQRKTARDQDVISIITEEEGKNEAEIARILEFETRKAEIDAQLKTDALSKKLTHEESLVEITRIAKEKELAVLQASSKANQALNDETNKKEKSAKEANVNLEKVYAELKGKITGQGFQLAATLAADGSKTQFAIQKAAALAEILIADGKARALIPAQTAGILFPGNIAAAAALNSYVTTQTALGSAIVAASAIKGFEQGGFIGGFSGSFSGADNRVAQVKDGEMVLNANQQKNLMDMINSGGRGGDIVVQIDGREIARAVRTQLQQGFRLA